MLELRTVLHNAACEDPFDFTKPKKPAPFWVPNGNHTRVPNILNVQKYPCVDDSSFPYDMRGDTYRQKLGRPKPNNRRFESQPQTQMKDPVRKWRESNGKK